MKKVSVVLLAVLMTFLSCGKESTDLSIRINLVFGDQPLVMFQDYDYPDGRKIRFSRVSFFVSEVTLQSGGDTELIIESDYLNMTDSHSTLDDANEGLLIYEGRVDLDNVETISFNLGLTEAQNNTVPADYTAGHPLANSAEYWIGWSSYIFAKIEGQVDMDRDGNPETNMALHLGSNNVRKEIILNNQSTNVDLNLELDVRSIFNGSKIYDIEANPQIHSLAQIEAILELADNFIHAITLK